MAAGKQRAGGQLLLTTQTHFGGAFPFEGCVMFRRGVRPRLVLCLH